MNCSLGFDILWEPPSSLPTCVGMKYRKGFKTLSRHNQWRCTVPATCQEFFFLFFFHLLSFPHLSFWGDHCLFHISSGQKGSICSSQAPPHTNGPGSVGKQNGAGLMGSPPALTWGLRGRRNQQHTRPAADEPARPPHLSGSKQSVCVSASLTSPHLRLWVRFPCHSSIPGLQVEEAALVQSRCQSGETAFLFFFSLSRKRTEEKGHHPWHDAGMKKVNSQWHQACALPSWDWPTGNVGNCTSLTKACLLCRLIPLLGG